MQCQQCGRKVSFLRARLGQSYCSAEHKRLHGEELNQLGLLRLLQMTSEATSGPLEAAEETGDTWFAR